MHKKHKIEQYSEFKTHTTGFVKWLINCIQNNEINNPKGWNHQLSAYQYRTTCLNSGCKIRLCFKEKLKEALKKNDQPLLLKVVNEIMCWGGTGKQFLQKDVANLKICFGLLEASYDTFIEAPIIINTAVASFSKIYEMYNPKYWIIYDSRVGYTLNFYEKKYCEKQKKCNCRTVFYVPRGRGVNNANVNYINTHRQAQQCFIYGSWLCRAIAEKLNDENILLPKEAQINGTNQWSAFHVEMVLFMLKKIKQKHWK